MKKTRKILTIILILILLLSCMSSMTNAADRTTDKGSLTITKYETGYDEEKQPYKKPLKDVTFTIYKVEDDTTDKTVPTKYEDGTYLEEEGTYTTTQTTNEDGQVTFGDLALGRYLVVEVKAPENVVQKIPNFLVDIPMTNSLGTDYIYNVKLEPKNETVYGGIVLTKLNQEEEPLQNVTFKLQQKQNDNTWKDYPSGGSSSLSTDEFGKITVEGLPLGDYRFVEISLGTENEEEGYILDNKTAYNFNVGRDSTGLTVVTPDQLIVTNEIPTIQKTMESVERPSANTNTVKDETGNSVDFGDIITFKIVCDVPSVIENLKTYTITDTMEEGLAFVNGSLNIQGVVDDGSKTALESVTDYTLVANTDNFVVTFVNANLSDYKQLEVTYKAVLNKTELAQEDGYDNTAKLTYSTITQTNYEEGTNDDKTRDITENEIVYTGGLRIEKRANDKNGELLSGAEFKIASSKANAKNEIFIKDSDGKDIVLTTENGLAGYYGLSYGTYYLVETKAPTYTERVGEEMKTRSYNLLRNPVEIEITADTYKVENAEVIANKKGTLLPLTGETTRIIFVVLGLVLVVIAIILYKKSKDDEKVNKSTN